MFRYKKLALGAMVSLGLSATTSMAADFTSHYTVDEKTYHKYAKDLSAEDKIELRQYLDFMQREPCQEYKEPPQGFVRQGCALLVDTPTGQVSFKNVIKGYEVHFALDSAEIDSHADTVLKTVAQEIKIHGPSEITVTGHTDKAGPSDYNISLSQKRAVAVSDALIQRGVEHRLVDKAALGESKPAIKTKDGVALYENRRVVIEFRK